MLSPLLYLWLIKEGKRWVSLKFFVCLAPFIVMQVHNGLYSSFYYARSILLLWTVYVTVYAFCWALLKSKDIERLFDELMVLNLCAATLALVVLFTPAKELLWNTNLNQMTGSTGWAPRLALLTSEPSVYGQLMAPLLIFAALRLFQNPTRRNFTYVVIITIPLLLSQSFGAISICSAGLGAVVLFKFRHILRRRYAILFLGMAAIFLVGLIMIPSPISRRITLISSGKDSSVTIRTSNVYLEAYMIAKTRSLWWGVGPGQAKLYNSPRILNLLGFQKAELPNSTADVFVSLGIIGVIVKLIAEIYLFFSTGVRASAFRLAMFVIAFIYQFTGGSVTNVQEYLLWCFAFAPFFPWLNIQSVAPARVRLETV
jgi:hypothetical protein